MWGAMGWVGAAAQVYPPPYPGARWEASPWANAAGGREGTNGWDSSSSRGVYRAVSRSGEGPRAMGKSSGCRVDNAGRGRHD